MRERLPRPSATRVLVIGIACGLAALLLVRVGVVLLVGGLRTLAFVGIAGAVWLAWARASSKRRRS